ncbi:MAG: ice-binding family protein [Chryseosolibacter sp.]
MKLKQPFTITRALALLAMLVFVFAGCEKDADPSVRPNVTATNPVNQATNIALNTTLSTTFNVEMDPASINTSSFTLKQGTTNVAGTTSYSGMTALFDPIADLAPNTLYTATLSTGVKNSAGTSAAKNYVWTFTTGAAADIVLPAVSNMSPAENETDVALNHAIVITFSEAMDKTTINSSTVFVKQGSTPISGMVTYTGTSATFTPTKDFNPNTEYTVTLTTGAKDLAGNAIAGNLVSSFTTGAAADILLPMVNATDPLKNATGIARNKIVTLTFNETMDQATINNETFILNQGSSSVAGTVSYSGMTATFTPTSILAASTTYTATITKGAKDLAGNALAADVVWEFTTGGTTSSLATVNLGTSGNYVILAQSAINNSATSAITGDLALSPAAASYITGMALTAATGYATSTQVTGKVYAADMADPTPINLTTAVGDMVAAYNDAAGRPSPDFLELGTGNLGGKTLSPGLYKWTSTVTLPADVTISGGADDIWIFQISGDLMMSSAVQITLEGGAQAKNIFWQIAGQATIGTNAHFEGIMLSKTGITFQTSSSIKGRALAQTAVILDGNAVTNP